MTTLEGLARELEFLRADLELLRQEVDLSSQDMKQLNRLDTSLATILRHIMQTGSKTGAGAMI